MIKYKTWNESVKYKTVLCTFLKSWREIFPVRSLSKAMNLCLICLQKSWIGLEILSMASAHWLLNGPGLIWRRNAWLYSQFINYTGLFRMTAVNSLVSWGAAVWVCAMQSWPEDWTSAQSAAGSPDKRDVHCFWCRIWQPAAQTQVDSAQYGGPGVFLHNINLNNW